MNGRYAILAIVMVMLAGIFHILFIMFDYGYNNPDTGAFTRLESMMNETLTGDYQQSAFDNNNMMRQFFGIGRFIILAICAIAFVVGVLGTRQQTN